MKRILSLVLALLTVMGMILGGGIASAEEVSPYKDVKVKRWSYADIMYVTENGLMNGTGEGIFAPAETMTRAMVVTVLYRLQGEPQVDVVTKFTDVKPKAWYGPAVTWAAEEEIVNGVGDGKFAPMETITREQLATIIMRYAPMEYIITKETADITGYADYKKVREYAREALSWANAVGLITGVTEDTLAPREGATREQFAAILRRFKEYDKFEYTVAYNAPAGYSTYTEKEYPLVTDADIYVALDGDDANPGTLEKPVATFERARDMVRELKKTKTGGITVAFKAGNYGRLNALTFTSEDAGTADAPITYCAYGDGDVIFCNGVIIKENEFKDLNESEKSMFDPEAVDSIKKVSLEGKSIVLNSRSYIFSDTGVCYEARFPNKNADGTDNSYKDFTTRYEEEGKAESEYDTLIISALAKKVADGFKTTEGMKVTGMFRTGWFFDTFYVKSYDKNTGMLTFDFSNPANFENGFNLEQYPLAYEDRMDDTIFFHNLAELIDTEGEYWIDPKTNVMYIYDPKGDYTIADGKSFIYFNSGAEHLRFAGLEFNGSTDTALQVSANHITFDRCKVGKIGGNQAIFAARVNHITVTNCEFYNFVRDGVFVDSNTNLYELVPGGNVIENNYFHDFGLPNFFGTALSLREDCAGRIAHNLFVNGSHGGVTYSGIDTVIEYNIFDNMMYNTEDYGAVYTAHSVTRRDVKIRYNLFMNMKLGAKYGIYLDECTAGHQVYGNIFYDIKGVSVVMNGGRDNVIRDNVFINSNFYSSNPGLYDFITNGNPEEVTEHYNYADYMNNKPKEGEEGYDTWRERWPILYNINFDPDKVGDNDCAFTTVNYFENNCLVNKKVEPYGVSELFGVFNGNIECIDSDNPIFTDPTHGDYSIREGVDFLDNQFYKIGRY
ncbi:MAG: S-layer homology domain-containing protein [Clostridia bacterium]|nr:S-layer homology domain-containing protein [Clostridia bacterium]